MEVDGKITETNTTSCEPCSSSGTLLAADGYCNECQEFLCNSCFQQHIKHRMSKHHKLGPLSLGNSRRFQVVMQTLKCKKHTNEVIKYYCQKHDVVGCGDCVVSDHNTCGVRFINDIAGNFRESSDFKNCLQRVNIIEDDCKQNDKQLLDNSVKNNLTLKKVLDDIRTFRKELDDYLDHIEEEILSEANESALEFDKTLSDLQRRGNDVCVAVSKINSSLVDQHNDNELFVRVVESKPHIMNLEQSITEVKTTNKVLPLTFNPHQLLKELMTSKIKLGIFGKTNNDEIEKKKSEDLVEDKTNDTITQTELEIPVTSKIATTQTDPDITKLLVSYPPDPRSAGFDVGKRVEYYVSHFCTVLGTVTSIDPEGYVTVNWDNNYPVLRRQKAGVGGEFKVKLV